MWAAWYGRTKIENAVRPRVRIFRKRELPSTALMQAALLGRQIQP